MVFDAKVCSRFIELLDMAEASSAKLGLSAEDVFFSSSKVQLDLNSLEPESKSFRREEEEAAEEVGPEDLTSAEGVSAPGAAIEIVEKA